LESRYLGLPFTLTEARILYELVQSPESRAKDVCASLKLTAGYVSRILQRFEKRGLIRRAKGVHDAREARIRVTRKGVRTEDVIDRRTNEEWAVLLRPLSKPELRRLSQAFKVIASILSSK
jgi:DNA-binding MarR family transcriptional regulator